MASEYTYDDEGETWPFFVLAVLSFILIPLTISWGLRIYRQDNPLSINKDIKGAILENETTLELENTIEINKFQKKQKSSAKYFNKTFFAIVIGWALCLYIAKYQTVETQLIGAFDPYTILDISAFSSEKEVKSRYRKLSLKFHPDKLPKDLTDAAKEEMEANFIQINLAYKALTDEVTRNNFLRYGHPDGPQEIKHGIAIPKIFVEGKYSSLMIVVYFLLIGGVLPFIVGSWWNNVKTHTKRGLHIDTAALFARKLADKSPTKVITPYELLDWVCQSQEIVSMTSHLPLNPQIVVKHLISRHLFRDFELTQDETKYEREKLAIVAQLPKLIDGLIEIASIFRFTDVVLAASDLRKCVVQGVPPIGKYQEILQLPYVDPKVVSQQEVKKLGKLFTLNKEEQKKALGISDDAKLETALSIAKSIPMIRVLDAAFVVPGENNEAEGGLPSGSVPPSAQAHISIKFLIKSPYHKSCPEIDDEDLKDEETIEYMRDPVTTTNESQPLLPYTYAPYFPSNFRNNWFGYLISQRDNKLVEGSSVATLENVSLANLALTKEQFIKGEGLTISTFKIALTTPTPGAEGNYTFRLVLKNNGYFGCDVDIPITMTVEQPKVPAGKILTKKVRKIMEIQGDADEEDDDTDYSGSDISDPEEDSLAGALAALRGGSVKSSAKGEEEEEEDDEGDNESIFTDINTDTEDES
ncbi:protein translocation protein Sec63p [[Candida] railenensis]|uniref:Protein translocation protein Sec63p n=1 Tax=[Candida] railenensis TaxID=45579 RepID=A0A9P0QKM7_9ASCO|nr:protein translocation protein Sec63p [[Candida] railenensis]